MQSDSFVAPPRNNFLRFIIDHNPCYLLSGGFMLLGCWLLNFALYTRAGDIQNLLLLLLIINLYEVCLIALGLVLIKRDIFKSDGRILLALEALFLVDVTFINGIISTIDFRIGLLINIAVLVLAFLKVQFIFTRLRLPFAGRITAFVFVQIAFLMMVPTAYKWIATPRHGQIPTLAVYSSWWIVGFVPLIGLILHRPRQFLNSPHQENSLAKTFILITFASLLTHLYSAGWVYSIDFSPAFLSPLLLGLALAAILLESERLQRYLVARLQFGLIAFSIYFSTSPLPFFHSSLSPLRLTLFASALLFVYFIIHHDSLVYLWTAAACICAAILGPTTSLIWQNLIDLSTSSSRRLIPRTTLQWGIASVGASFALLGLGALFSLKKNSTNNDSQPAVLD